MEKINNWLITEKEKTELIEELTDELAVLRSKAAVSQEELSKIIGISRQTYGDIERKKRKMSWNTYLSLILFFDYTKSTHSMIRNLSSFPSKFLNDIQKENKKGGCNEQFISRILTKEIDEKLDAQALHAIKTVVMLEYARCSNLSDNLFLKTFDDKKI